MYSLTHYAPQNSQCVVDFLIGKLEWFLGAGKNGGKGELRQDDNLTVLKKEQDNDSSFQSLSVVSTGRITCFAFLTSVWNVNFVCKCRGALRDNVESRLEF